MKNKKGFTLVELLAVIAILAILVIISLPNVIGMFNEAKKNSFVTELRNIYKLAGQQWINDSLFETAERTYSRCETCTGKSLQLSGRQNLDYYVVINKAGEVTKFYATDGTFQYQYEGRLLPTDITDAELVADLDISEVLNIDEDDIAYGTDENCKYKLVSEYHTFSNGEHELCFNVESDNYPFDVLDYDLAFGDEVENTIIRIENRNITADSYLRVYENNTKNKLLYEFKQSDFPEHRLLAGQGDLYFIDKYLYVDVGHYNPYSLYYEAYNISYSKSGAKNLKHITQGFKWVKDQNVINEIEAIGSPRFDNCIYGNNGFNCNGRIYTEIMK